MLTLLSRDLLVCRVGLWSWEERGEVKRFRNWGTVGYGVGDVELDFGASYLHVILLLFSTVSFQIGSLSCDGIKLSANCPSRSLYRRRMTHLRGRVSLMGTSELVGWGWMEDRASAARLHKPPAPFSVAI